VPILETTVWRCPECAAEREFEQPPCFDGHGLDCPEWICCSCGTALIVGFTFAEQVVVARAARGAA